MRVSIVGGGPAGLYLGLLLKKQDPGHEVEVVERNPADATYGWGVVFSDRTLGSFREADHRSFLRISDELVIWDAIDIRHRGEVVRCGGQTFSGISRKQLLRILQGRCDELGVRMTFEREIADPTRLADADIVVAADGANSATRRLHEDVFRPRLDLGRSRYVWYGSTLPLDSFTFIFRETEHGLFQVHAYPFDGTTSTFIVECAEPTWRRAALDRATEDESLAFCESLFAEDLRGHRLLSNRSQWLAFPTVRCTTWRRGNLVLVGDAAHTAHFSIGSGTKLAMEDSIALADALARHGVDLDAALAEYEAERRPRVERFQEAAEQSQSYFEHTSRYTHMEPLQFGFHLLSRSGRMDYSELRQRDPRFVAAVDAWFAGRAREAGDGKAGFVVASPPGLVPLELRGVEVPNRVAVAVEPPYEAEAGIPGAPHRRRLEEAAATGAGLVVTDAVAVTPEGRITPADAGLWTGEHAEAWQRIVGGVRASWMARLAVRLSHAGRRAATRPRRDGVDRPLREGAWPLLAASPIAYGPGLVTPREMTREDMDRVRDAFAAAARWAVAAGFDLVELDMSQGYLLGGFVSPVSNIREDLYGGSLERRLRFPLEVLETVREAIADDRPVAVAVTADDRIRGGTGLDEAVSVARALDRHGADLVEVRAGQTDWRSRPIYDPYDLIAASDRVRNEARVLTWAFATVTTVDQVSTIVAGGRADLCYLLDR